MYCCDGAYDWAKGKVKIDKNIGDFDSLGYPPDPPPQEIYPAEKDFTDGEIAIKRLIDDGADEIEIYGGGGGREDHFLGNLHLLFYAHGRGVKAIMRTDNADMFAAGGKIEVVGAKGATLSVLPFGGALHIMGSAGLKYAYPPVITYGQCRGISNVALEDYAFVEIAQGDVALIIINRGEV